MGVPFSASCATEGATGSSTAGGTTSIVSRSQSQKSTRLSEQAAGHESSAVTEQGVASADRVPRSARSGLAPMSPSMHGGASSKRKPTTTFTTVLSYGGVPGQSQRISLSSPPLRHQQQQPAAGTITTSISNGPELASFSMALTDESETVVVTGILGEVSEDYEVESTGRTSIAAPSSPCPEL